ncbi:hypothetical protein EBZ37_07970 [bacterium]|nr:hypothetical protein [bacterium]
MSFWQKVLLFVGFLAAGCSGPALVNRQSYDSEDAEYREIAALYDAGAFESVLKWANSYVRKQTRGARWPNIVQLRGLARMALKQADAAEDDFKDALASEKVSPDLKQELIYQLAWAQFEAGKSGRALETLSAVQLGRADIHLQVNYRVLKARIYLSRGLELDAVSQVLIASRLAPASYRVLVPTLTEALKRISEPVELKKTLSDFSDSVILDHVLFRLAMIEVGAGNSPESQRLLRSLVSRFPDSSLYSQAASWLKASKLNVPSDATRIGVLLPISGKFSSAGSKTLKAIRMGFKTSTQLKGRIQLVIEDSGESPAEVLKALDKLIFEHHVMAVLGPITGKGLEAVAQRSQELGVPLISLARRDAPDGDFIFQGGLTLKLQIEALVKFAVEKRKKKRFAILYPQDRLGEAAAEFFWAAAETAGAEVRAVSSYPAEETDFRRAIDGLTGTLYTDARERERFALRTAIQKMTRGRGKKTRDEKLQLPPVVDFDGVFIPDVLKSAGQILPMFTYRDVDHVEFFGTSLWNSEDLARTLQKRSEGRVFFVDVFSNQEGVGSISHKFVEEFVSLYGSAPGPVEAVGFDAAAVLASAVARMEGSNSRERLRKVLLDVRDFSGITGMIQMRNSVLFRPLKVFTLKKNQIELVDRLQE